MRHIISALLIGFVFYGCAVKEQVVEIKQPSNQVKVIGEPINKIGEEIGSEEINSLHTNEITEEDSLLQSPETMNLALTYPSQVVGRYAKSSMNTILGFFSYKDIKYNLKVFDSNIEDFESIQNSFNQIRENGFNKVIALYSPKALDLLHSIDTTDLIVYLPLVNKNDVETPNENFIYGAISYDAQIVKLNEYSNINNAMFFQESFIGNTLKKKYEEVIFDSKVVKPIKNKKNYYKGIVKDYRLKNSTLFLNTNIIKTSILLSQMTVYEIEPRVILSTQINYNPKLLTLTQERDRKNFVVANSIDSVDDKLKDEVETFGGDIKYNWVDYSTLVGVNYLFDNNESNLLSTRIEENQVIYEPKLYKTTAFGFLEIK